jgi:hypothetical protein
MSMINLRVDSPFRPTDWRWQRAKAMRAAGRRSVSSRSDPWTARAASFQEAEAECRSDWDRLDLADDNPDLYDAVQMHESDARRGPRWEVEARILARQTPEEIGALLAMRPEVVEAYEKVFFHVTDRLDSRSWVLQSVMHKSIHSGISERDYDLIWKLYGYTYGPRVLDHLVGKIAPGIAHAQSAAQALGALRDSTRQQSVVKASIAMATLPVNSFTVQTILEFEAKLRDLERSESSAGSGSSAVMEIVKGVMEAMAWSVGDGSPDRPVVFSLAAADRQAAELRAHEMFAVVAGKGDPAGLADVRFPEPEGRGNDQASQ